MTDIVEFFRSELEQMHAELKGANMMRSSEVNKYPGCVPAGCRDCPKVAWRDYPECAYPDCSSNTWIFTGSIPLEIHEVPRIRMQATVLGRSYGNEPESITILGCGLSWADSINGAVDVLLSNRQYGFTFDFLQPQGTP